MNIDEMKKTAINMVNINDSIKAPLLKLNIKVNNNTTIPDNNELIVYVDKESTPTTERKTYTFNLRESLKINEEFIIEPELCEDKVLLKGYIIRNTEKEEIKTEGIMLFEGTNYIETNYTNAEISIIYPKNTDLVNLFLNNAIYGINNKNKILTLDDIYFKDCFTEEDGEISASFKRLNVGCISSKYGNFKLDSSGNLQVKSIIVDDKIDTGNELDLDLMYPIGSIYMNTTNIDPEQIFGGSWEQIAKGRTLVGVDPDDDDFKTPKKTGGSKYIQEHYHRNVVQYSGDGNDSGEIYAPPNAWSGFYRDRSWIDYRNTVANVSTGDSGNLPPYITCYIWQRIA